MSLESDAVVLSRTGSRHHLVVRCRAANCDDDVSLLTVVSVSPFNQGEETPVASHKSQSQQVFSYSTCDNRLRKMLHINYNIN